MNSPAKRPPEWPDRLAKLYTPVVADVLDKMGYRNQCMDVRIRPVWPEAKCAGFALTVQTVPARETSPPCPYAGELAAVSCDEAFEYLDGPIRRITAPDTPVPYSPPLEEFFLPKVSDIVRVARELYAY